MGSYRWIPWSFAGALGVVVMVNGALAYLAVSSSTGLVTEHPFESGNGYNRVLAAAAAQDALGWHGTLAFAAAGAETGDRRRACRPRRAEAHRSRRDRARHPSGRAAARHQPDADRGR